MTDRIDKAIARGGLVLTLGIIMALGIASQVSSGGEASLVNRLSTALAARDIRASVQLINEAKRIAYQEDVLSYMQDLWGRSDSIDLPRDVLEAEVIRINVADLLIQASQNGLLEINEEEFQKYARTLLNRGESEVVAAALFVLGRVDDPNDLDIIEPFAMLDTQYLARSAIVAIAMMCNEDAKATLGRLENMIKAQTLKDYLHKTEKQFDRLKESGHLCRR